MEAMREVLRGTLGRSLRGLGEEDRLAAAWTVACGCPMADHGRLIGYEAGLVRVEVGDAVWLRQMVALGRVLERELEKISGLKVTAIEFVTKHARGAGFEVRGNSGDKGKSRFPSGMTKR